MNERIHKLVAILDAEHNLERAYKTISDGTSVRDVEIDGPMLQSIFAKSEAASMEIARALNNQLLAEQTEHAATRATLADALKQVSALRAAAEPTE